MIRLALSAFAIAALGLGACASNEPPPPVATLRTPDGTPVVSASATPVVAGASAGASAYRAGFGIIESISLVNAPVASASAGSSAPTASGPYRVTIRMDEGNTQTLVVDNRAFLVGDRVQVMADGKLVRS
jgi:hypothetical protein